MASDKRPSGAWRTPGRTVTQWRTLDFPEDAALGTLKLADVDLPDESREVPFPLTDWGFRTTAVGPAQGTVSVPEDAQLLLSFDGAGAPASLVAAPPDAVAFLMVHEDRADERFLTGLEYQQRLRLLALGGLQLADAALRLVRDLPSLEALEFSYGSVDDDGLAAIGDLPALREIALGGTNVSPRGLTLVRRFPTVQDVRLERLSLDPASIHDLLHLPNLRALLLDDAEMAPGTLVHLADLPGLRFLSLSIDEENLEEDALRPLAKLSALEEIDLGDTAAGSTGLSYLGVLPSLRTLALECKKADDAWLVVVAALAGLSRLELTMTPHFSDGGLAQLGSLLGLRELSLSGRLHNPLDFAWLGSLRLLDTLRLGLTGISAEAFGRIAPLPHLRRLGLAGHGRFADGHLTYLPAYGGLEWLDLSGAVVTADGLPHLVGLPNLAQLGLRGTPLDDQALATVGELHGLEELDLSETRVTDAGLHHLRHLPRLRRLRVWGTAVTMRGAEVLGDLPDLVVEGALLR